MQENKTKIPSQYTLNKVASPRPWPGRGLCWLKGRRVEGVREMCSGTNFIKTLELNELVNHIAQLGCCPALDWEPQLNSLSPAPSPLCFPFSFALSLRLYLFLLQCGLKNNFRKQKCNERRNELQTRCKGAGGRARQKGVAKAAN